MQTYTLHFSLPIPEFEQFLEEQGEVPLPPYITESSAQPAQYQTVFAHELGSAAAPTAGLHFTPELIQRLSARGQVWKEVTLHVGMGTFLPLREERLTDNHLHQEYTVISETTAEAIREARQNKLRILAVGTTTTRTLEAHSTPTLQAGALATDLFIYPGYQFRTVTALLTNFHLPHSSLLALVAAFIQNDALGNLRLTDEQAIAELQRIYAIAIAEQYRFFSFGDAMLVL